MPGFNSTLRRAPALDESDREWIRQLVGDWQVIADVSFADLVVLVRTDNGATTVARHCRPATTGTAYREDIVGNTLEGSLDDAAVACLDDGQARTVRYEGNTHMLYPVRHGEKIVAALDVIKAAAQEGDTPFPTLGPNEYAEISNALLTMVSTGEFPLEGAPTGYRHGTPRLTDGFVHLDDEGEVVYASPNATSNFHRLGLTGPLTGHVLIDMMNDVIDDHSRVEESLQVVALGRAPWLAEVQAGAVTLALRALPLRNRGKRLGALLLCRDVTEIRRREEELVTKDATIREINHRVKNNLQTVSALLRMQARRAPHPETRQALGEAQRRVAAIALVHQVLSQSITERANFDEVISPLLAMASDIAATGVKVEVEVAGTYGELGANQTTALAVVLNELVSNAVEHGLPAGGTIYVHGERESSHLTIDVRDDGIGLGEEGPGAGLGTYIVQTLVAGELNGSIEWQNHESGGTLVHIEMECAEPGER